MNKRLAIIVEGQTELSFTNKLLKPHLLRLDINVINLRGGNISVEKIHNDAKKLIPNFDYVTTLVDYYGFKNSGHAQSVEELENNIKNGFPDKLIPYIQKYEFEALVFSDVSVMQTRFNKNYNAKRNPEDINHNNPPSKILKTTFPTYDKVLDGVDILRMIGLQKIREKCPRFSQWISKLESL